MSMYARVVSGVVEEIFTPQAGFTIAQSFNSSMPGEWIECDGTSGVEQRWTYDGTNFHAPTSGET